MTPSVSRRSRVAGDVEDRLHPGADDRDGSPGQSRKIGRLVEGLAGAAVDTTDPAGGEDADPGKAGQCRRRSDSRRRVPGGRDRERQLANADLGYICGRRERLELVRVQSDCGLASRHANGRRHDPCCPKHCLQLQGDLEVAGPWQAVADDRRLEGHDGSSRVERRLDFRCDRQRQASTHVNHDLAFTVASGK